ncbi:MAG: DNA replication/repair protein RecF [Myxococcota bacterium]
MYLERLRGTGFRNLEPFDLALSPRIVLVRGKNGQGKTNLLEALYLCATGRSFRFAMPKDMLAHGGTRAHLEAAFVRRSVRHAVEISLGPRQRQLRVDERPLRRLATLVQLVNVVSFFPDDLRIVKGSPEERRRFLDRLVANQQPAFIDTSLAYLKALRSRNALLRQAIAPEAALLDSFDEALVRYGTLIHTARVEVLAALAPLAAALFADMMPGLMLSASLDSGIPAHDTGPFAERFAAALGRARRADRARGVTSVGPHRADLDLALAGHEARSFASQGQQRTLVLALKLAELHRVRELYDGSPILLLDDVSSELDGERSRLLFDAIRGMEGQVWVSTTGAVALPVGDDAQVLEIDAGRIA